MPPMVNTCCCGCTLVVGTRIISILYIIGYAYGIGSNIVNLPALEELDIASSVEAWVYVGVAFASFFLVVNILLLIATYNENNGLVMLWIFSTMFAVLYNIGSSIYVGVAFIDNRTITASLIAGSVINILLTIYFLIVVWSWNEEVKGRYQQFANQPAGYGPNITVVTNNSSTFAQQPGGYAPQPSGYAPQPGGYAPQPGGYAPQPGGYAPQPGLYNPYPAPPAYSSESKSQTVVSTRVP